MINRTKIKNKFWREELKDFNYFRLNIKAESLDDPIMAGIKAEREIAVSKDLIATGQRIMRQMRRILTYRQREVIYCLARNYNCARAAARSLGISHSSVIEIKRAAIKKLFTIKA